jgi:hypothetical protein
MKYSSNYVIQLDADDAITAGADAIIGKRHAAGDGDKCQKLDASNFTNQTTPKRSLAEMTKSDPPVDQNSLLTIVAHCDPGNGGISERSLSPQHLAKAVLKYLGGTKIRRISLDMCHGGGKRGPVVGKNVESFEQKPTDSFAYRFASYAGQLARDVTARTDIVKTIINTDVNKTKGTETITDVRRVVGSGDNPRHKTVGDKIIFVTHPESTVDNSVAPTMRFAYED